MSVFVPYFGIEFCVLSIQARFLCSPFCKTCVFTCESCSALLEDSVDGNVSQDEIRVCRKCGFLNLIDDELRKSLQLPVTRPMTTESARIIQRTISEERYIAYKQNELDAIQAKLERGGDGSIKAAKSEHTNRGLKRRRSDMEEKTAPSKRQKGDEEGAKGVRMIFAAFIFLNRSSQLQRDKQFWHILTGRNI